MSKVLDELAASPDGLERDLGRALKAYQNTKAGRGDPRRIGYEPRDIRQSGAAAVIESRVRNQSSGFDDVPAALSYEAIVLAHQTALLMTLSLLPANVWAGRLKCLSPQPTPSSSNGGCVNCWAEQPWRFRQALVSLSAWRLPPWSFCAIHASKHTFYTAQRADAKHVATPRRSKPR